MSSVFMRLLPSLDGLKGELKGKVIACWELAKKEGGWSDDDLRGIPFTLLIPDCPMNLFEHTEAVTNIALSVYNVLVKYPQFDSLNRDYLLAGALLHEVGKMLEYKKTPEGIIKSEGGELLRHPFSGAGLAMKLAIPYEVVHIIATHAKEGEGGYRSPESVIVHYADFTFFHGLKAILQGESIGRRLLE